MRISFRSAKLHKLCENYADCCRRWGDENAATLRRRLDDLHASRHLAQFLELPHVRYETFDSVVRVRVSRTLAIVIELSGQQLKSGDTHPRSPTTATIKTIEELNGSPRKH